ncbi:M23 family metallopeptidase [Tumebacillus sp. ITR2]|uniref:M23 family metallopeptidase n=1 Tax=Tumebacillus amylolyticus TaxID=2801339 RepID=A0ABS1JA44_9BACL|nr:M23 family metallopeptidase [Tumebacillus amylolyticus]MBL0387050.1 M23 family metallopeptidase [Tumebacillus amylolyticus]
MAKFEFWKSKRKEEEPPESESWNYDRFQADTTRSSLFSSEEEWDVTRSNPVFTSAPPGSLARPRSYEDFLRARGGGYGSSGQGGRYSDSAYGSGRRFYEEDEGSSGLPVHRLMQVLGAVAMIGIFYFTFRSEAPSAVNVQAYVKQHLTNDTNLSGLTAWWQSNVSDKAALPAMSTPSDTSTTTGTGTPAAQEAKFSFTQPVQGAKVKTPYDGKDQQGISFTAALGADVHAAAKGTVEKIEKGEGEDYSVTINHGGTNGRTIYSHLASVNVAANDTVTSDQKIGTLTKKGTTASFFFAYQKDGAYVNPSDLLNASTDTEAPKQTKAPGA